MNILRAGGWFSLSAGLVLGVSSCDGTDDVSEITGLQRPDRASVAVAGESRCVPGQTSACVGVCGAFSIGYQVCAADGRAYGECICPPSPAISMGTGREGGATVIPPRLVPGGAGPLGASGGPVQTSAFIGASCEADADCGGGELGCLTATSNTLGGGGPAGGYCSMPCNDSADCSAVDRTSTCGVLAGRSLCLRSCRSQDPAEAEDKCLGRADLTCVSGAANGDAEPIGEPEFGICQPACQSDAACAGRSCDLASGLCTNVPRAGEPIGAACDEPAACAAGICLGASAESPGLCSAFCTLGGPGCGFDGSEAVIGAACLLPQVPGEGPGDRGLCFALCEVDADCDAAGFLCVPEPAAENSGRSGVCLPPAFVAPEEPEEPEPATGLGLACEQDGDCIAGLTCLTAGSDPFAFGGGPPGGYCSQPCEVAEDCAAGGGCVTTAAGGFCFAGCTPGAAGQCGGRGDVECLAVDTFGACLPLCTSDAQCGELSCDVTLGLCVAEPPDPLPPPCTTDADCTAGICDLGTGECVAAPVSCALDADCTEGVCDLGTNTCVPGAPCTLDAECSEQVCDAIAGSCRAAPPAAIGAACVENVDCTGEGASADDTRLCLALEGAAFCSGGCVLGTPFGCEAYGTDAFCVLPVDGDVGACLELCNAPEECAQPGYDCLDLGTEINERGGACLPPEPPAADEAAPDPAAPDAAAPDPATPDPATAEP
jgi:hypothetical protein